MQIVVSKHEIPRGRNSNERGKERKGGGGGWLLMAGDSSASLGWRSQRGNCVTSKCVHAQTRGRKRDTSARASKIPKPGRNPREGCVLEHMPRYYSRPRCCPRANESADNSLHSTNTEHLRVVFHDLSPFHNLFSLGRFERNYLQAVIFVQV